MENKKAHTPGPWQANVCGCVEKHVPGEPHGKLIVLHNLANPNMIEDARLMAAAPDLLVACQLMLTVHGLGIEAPHAFEVMRAAVDAATGKQQRAEP